MDSEQSDYDGSESFFDAEEDFVDDENQKTTARNSKTILSSLSNIFSSNSVQPDNSVIPEISVTDMSDGKEGKEVKRKEGKAGEVKSREIVVHTNSNFSDDDSKKSEPEVNVDIFIQNEGTHRSFSRYFLSIFNSSLRMRCDAM